MPSKRRGNSGYDTRDGTEKWVMKQLSKNYVHKLLTDQLDSLTEKNFMLNERLDKKDEYIAALEARLSLVEADLDQLEQYSRRSNLQFFGIPASYWEKIPLASCSPLSTKQWQSQLQLWTPT